MKGNSVLAIAVCLACFLIGYLAYLATVFLVDSFIEKAAPCQYTVETCAQQEMSRKSH